MVDLSDLRESGLVASTIAQKLGLHDAGGLSALTLLTQYLQRRHLLLVLDNFEQVIEASTEVADLLAACPNLKVLVTSREALRLKAERAIHLEPLAVPDMDRPLSAESLPDIPAVQLFIERARAVRPSFSPLLQGDHARAVTLICVGLDGLPLAIELAAAWVRVLDIAEIAERLSTRLEFLVSAARDAPVRQHSLRAALDWSYALLTSEEQTLLRQLSVFAGGWTLAAAENVCGRAPAEVLPGPRSCGLDSREEKTHVLETLTALVDKSLVVPDQEAGTPARYRLLETIREYAAEQLTMNGEGQRIKSRHAEYFLHLAEEAQMQVLTGPSQAMWLDELTREHDNFRAALRHASEEPTSLVELRLVAALGHFWSMRGTVHEGRGWLQGALRRSPDAPAYLWAMAAAWAGLLALFQGDVTGADSWLDPALRMAAGVVDPAKERFARVFVVGGLVARVKQDYRRSLELFEKANAFAARVGEIPPPIVRQQFGAALLRAGESDRAEVVLRETLADAFRADDKYAAASALSEMGMIAMRQGNHEQAVEQFRHALSLATELGLLTQMSYYHMALAAVAAAVGDFYQAANLLGTADVLCNRCGIPLALPPYVTLRDVAPTMDIPQILRDARINLGDANFNLAWQAGVEHPAADIALDSLNATR
jgi:non-specific serine/threonine protein kinase